MWYAIATAAMVVAVATFFSAPLETHANPLKTPLHTTAPWYFLWLQGMLKLGDKTMWGVVIPTVIFLILFAVPYLDPGPSRLAKHRKVGITVGILVTISILLLTFMGTGLWGVSAPPAVELVQEFVPEEGVGELREIPYEELPLGLYDTSDPTTYPGGQLGHLLEEMHEAVERDSIRSDNNFFEGNMTMEIVDWQTDLKQVKISVFWEEVPEGSPDGKLVEADFEKTVYIHKNSGYELFRVIKVYD